MAPHSPAQLSELISGIKAQTLHECWQRSKQIEDDLTAHLAQYRRAVYAGVPETAERIHFKILDKAREVNAQPRYQSLRLLASVLEMDKIKLIMLLLNWTRQQTNVSGNLSNEQIRSAALALYEQAGGNYSLEEFAYILRSGLMGEYGEFFRLDLQTLSTWFKAAFARRFHQRQAFLDSIEASRGGSAHDHTRSSDLFAR